MSVNSLNSFKFNVFIYPVFVLILAPVGRPHTVHMIPQYDPQLTPIQGNFSVVLRVGIGAYPLLGIPARQLDIAAADLSDEINLPLFW